jgi:HSP20 family molecular chaperone IbpA
MRQPKSSFMRMNSDSFTLLRDFTEVVDRLFAFPGCCAVDYPDVRIQRRNGIFRVSVALANVHISETKAYVRGAHLVLEGVFERSGKRFREEIPMPPGISADEVTTRFWEGTLALEFPFVAVSRPVSGHGPLRHYAASPSQ